MNRMTVAMVAAAFGAGTLSGSTIVEILAAPRFYQKSSEFTLSATQQSNFDSLVANKLGAPCSWERLSCYPVFRSQGVDEKGAPLPPVRVIDCLVECKMEAITLSDVPDGVALESK